MGTSLLPGYDAKALGASIRRYTTIAERNIGYLEELDTRVKAALSHLEETKDASTARDDVEMLSVVYDRLVKAGLNLVKATDELARLHSFLQGGPDSRPDLSSMSEVELRAVVYAAVKTLGITDFAQLQPPPVSTGYLPSGG